MWPFKKKPAFDQSKMKVGDIHINSRGMAGTGFYACSECGVCKKQFVWNGWAPYRLEPSEYGKAKYGKLNVREFYFCKTHSDTEIQKKIDELSD